MQNFDVRKSLYRKIISYSGNLQQFAKVYPLDP